MRESTVDAVGSDRPAAPAASGQIDHHSFVGTPREVAVGLYALPSRLVGHTFYALLLQGDREAEIRIFERTGRGDRDGRVAVWEGDTLGGLCDEVVACCAGPASTSTGAADAGRDQVAAVLELLRAYGDFTEVGPVPAPPTARGAFGHPMRRYASDQAVRAVVVAGERSG